MPMMKEKRFNFAGFHVGFATERSRAERIRNNPLYRYILRPGLNLVSRRDNGHATLTKTPPTPKSATSVKHNGPAAEIWEKVSKIGWYHTIDLGHGVVTPGFIDNRDTAHLFGLPADLSGKRCLDIGTYDGFWSFEMERRGASEVIGIDVDSPADHDIPRRVRRSIEKKATEENGREEEVLRGEWDKGLAEVGLQFPGEGFRVAKEILGSKARREVLNVYDLSPDKLGMFDVVIISQLLLRLRDPQTILENMFSVAREIAIVAEPFDTDLESFDSPLSQFVGTSVLGVWWNHSIKSMKMMMEVAGFEPVEEVSRFPVENRAGRFWKVILKGHVPAEVTGG
jgi:tRNA (mo5U34)-methyltransferase